MWIIKEVLYFAISNQMMKITHVGLGDVLKLPSSKGVSPYNNRWFSRSFPDPFIQEVWICDATIFRRKTSGISKTWWSIIHLLLVHLYVQYEQVYISKVTTKIRTRRPWATLLTCAEVAKINRLAWAKHIFWKIFQTFTHEGFVQILGWNRHSGSREDI